MKNNTLKSKKKFKFSILTVIFIYLLLSFATQGFAEISIAVVDMQEVLDKSEVGKAARARIDRKFKPEKERIDALEIKLQDAKVSLQKQASIISAKALRDKSEDIMEMERDFQKQISDYSEEYQTANNESIKEILARLEEVFKEFTQKGKFKTIIEKDERVVVYSADTIEITNDVIKELDS